MSDSLREALEKRLETLPVLHYENRYPVEALPKAEILDLLALHPAESVPDAGAPLLGTRPQPTLDAEASIEEAARVIARHAAFGLKWDELTEPVQDFWRSAARATLTAASLLPGALDREAVEDAIRDELLPSLGLEIANPLSVEAAAAVMALVRPLPTREQIAGALRKRLVDSNFNDHLHEPVRTQTIDQWVDVLAGAVNPLFSGGEE